MSLYTRGADITPTISQDFVFNANERHTFHVKSNLQQILFYHYFSKLTFWT